MTHAPSEPTRAATRPQPADYRLNPLAEERAAAWRLYLQCVSLDKMAAQLRWLLDHYRAYPASEENLEQAKTLARALEHLLAGVQPASPRGLTDQRPHYQLSRADGEE